MPTVQDLIEELSSYDPDEHIAYALWSPEDVTCGLSNYGIQNVPEDDINAIVDFLHRHVDSEQGINWDHIDAAITEHFKSSEDFKTISGIHDNLQESYSLDIRVDWQWWIQKGLETPGYYHFFGGSYVDWCNGEVSYMATFHDVEKAFEFFCEKDKEIDGFGAILVKDDNFEIGCTYTMHEHTRKFMPVLD